MTSGILQDSFQTSQSTAPRFRPYASPNHRVTKGRYITSNDPRGYIPVYEYPLNGLWIMMDIDDGYILWTGIWKALGNSKADIVKMIDSQPDLAPLIRRVRGGYLKIQGTWMPYEVALRLSRRVAWPIREDLIPLFGPTFPDTCLSPDQPGYGQVVASGHGRRRMRRNNQAVLSAMGHHPPNPQASWTVVTPNSRISPGLGPHLPSSAKPSRHPSDIYYPAYQHPTLAVPMAPTTTPVGPSTSQSVVSDASSVRERGNRYSPYHGHRNRTPSVPYSTALSLDIPSLARHEHAPSHYRSGAADTEVIRLPPIQPPPHFQGASQASYALPPISALEDLRGIHSCDSAAVLRRLQANDDVGSETGRTAEGQVWTRGRSLSAPPQKHPSVDAPLSSWSPKSAASPRLRTLTGYKFMRPSFSSQPSPHPHISVVFPSEPCGDGNSTCDPSPISPATPRSAVSSTNDSHHFSRVPLALNKHGQTTPQGYASVSHEWPKGRGDMYVQQQQQQRHEGVFRGRETRLSASGCRNSYGEDSDNDSMHPVRPW